MPRTKKAPKKPLHPGPAPRYDVWEVLGMGGFGGQFDPLVSPHDTNLVLMRCDMTGAYISHDAGQSWRNFNLRCWAPYFTFDPSDPKTIYGGNMGLWRSEDTGKTWSMIWPDPTMNTVEHWCDDHADVYLTSDDPRYTGPDTRIPVIAVHPTDSNHLYMATSCSWYNPLQGGGCPTLILFSPDRGETWEKLADLENESAHAIHITKTGRVYVVRPSGVLVLEGGSIERFAGPEGRILWTSVGEQDGKVLIYAITETSWEGQGLKGGVWVSEDEGRTWRSAAPGILPLLYHPGGAKQPTFTVIACSAQHAATAYVAFRRLPVAVGERDVYSGMLKTTDAGRTWELILKERPGLPALGLDGHFEGRVNSEYDGNVYYDSLGITVAPTDPDICYMTDSFRSIRTLDGGRKWFPCYTVKVGKNRWRTTGADVTAANNLVIDPFDPRHMFLLFHDIGLQRSTDAGYSWFSANTTIPTMWRNCTYDLEFDPDVRGLLWANFSGTHCLPRTMMWDRRPEQRELGHFRGGFGLSRDGGGTWEIIPDLTDHVITDILLDPTSAVGSRTLYVASFGKGVLKSADNGETWVTKNDGIPGDKPFAWKLARGDDGALYLLLHRQHEDLDGSLRDDYDGALYRSTDGAETWTKLSLPEGCNGPVWLSVDPEDPQRLCLAAWGRTCPPDDICGGVFVSTDGGRTWRNTLSKMQHANCVRVDPKRPNVLYTTGFDAAAYRSLDKGETWERIKGFNFKWACNVVPDPVDDSRIYICTWGCSLWHGPAAGDPNAAEDIITPIRTAMG